MCRHGQDGRENIGVFGNKEEKEVQNLDTSDLQMVSQIPECMIQWNRSMSCNSIRDLLLKVHHNFLV